MTFEATDLSLTLLRARTFLCLCLFVLKAFGGGVTGRAPTALKRKFQSRLSKPDNLSDF